VGHAARTAEQENDANIYLENMKGNLHFEDLRVDVFMILKLILEECDEKLCTNTG
jgi:hypothetical protein